MKCIYLLGLLMGLAGTAAAQEPAAAPVHLPPTGFRAGLYQLKRSPDWKRAKLLYDPQSLSVSDATHKTQYPLVYPADSVQAFVMGRDTFSVVRAVDIPRPTQHFASLFARQLYRRAGYQVLEYVAVLPSPQPPVAYVVLAQGAQARAVLSPNRVQFRMALSKLLADYPALSHQLELDPNILPEQLPELLAAYSSWKNSGGKK